MTTTSLWLEQMKVPIIVQHWKFEEKEILFMSLMVKSVQKKHLRK